jgi:hypothetical protein
MKQLREIDNDNSSQEVNSNNTGSMVKLDENEITKDQLEERLRRQKASERIIEVNKNEYKTLHRLNG